MPPPSPVYALRISSRENQIVRLISECATHIQLAQVHARAVTLGLASRSFVAAKLIRALSSHGFLSSAHAAAAADPTPNAFVWTALVRGHATSGCAGAHCDALSLYAEMRLRRTLVRPLTFTVSSALKAASHLRALDRGRQVHTDVFKNAFDADAGVGTALIDFYAKCGRMRDARVVFDRLLCYQTNDVQAWNTMIASFMGAGDVNGAQLLFDRMPEKNSHTFVEMIGGYASHGRMEHAERLFEAAAAEGLADAFVRTAMISAHASNGSVDDARAVFDTMKSRDAACWNAMIIAYSSSGRAEEAVAIFKHMLRSRGRQRAKPNSSTVVAVAYACAQCGSPSMADWFQSYVDSHRCKLMNSHVAAALIDMHSKCGDVERAYLLFHKWKHRDLVCYSAMMSGFGMHGRGRDVIRLFDELEDTGIAPDAVCFLSVLSACSHGGMVDEGREYFQMMTDHHSVTPTAEHYICMVDLLGRAGCVDEAYRLITEEAPLSVQVHAGIWSALLSACRIHCNVEVGEAAAKKLLQLEPGNAGNYMLLSSLYANTGKWDKAQRVRALMRQLGTKKSPGWSEVDAGGCVRKFVSSELCEEALVEALEVLNSELREHGYAPAAAESA